MKKYIVSILIFVLVSIFSTAVLAQGKGNRRGNANSNNQPMKPCDQLTGDDLLVKGRKCTLSNGQVTTIGAYQKSQNQNSGSGQNRGRNQMGGLADAKAPHRNDSLTYENVEWCNKMNDDAGIAINRQCKSPNGQVTTVGQYCQSNPSAKGCNQGNNRNRQTGNSDSLISEIGLPAARGNRKNQNANGQNQVTGGTIPVYATGSVHARKKRR